MMSSQLLLILLLLIVVLYPLPWEAVTGLLGLMLFIPILQMTLLVIFMIVLMQRTS